MSTTQTLGPQLSMMTGTAKGIGQRLNQLNIPQVIAIGMEHASDEEFRVFTDTLAQLIQLMQETFAQRERETLATIEALAPKVPSTPAIYKELALLARARTAVLELGVWLTEAQIGSLSNFSASNPNDQPTEWKHSGSIFAVTHQGIDYFPRYGLEAKAEYRPFKAMAKVIDVFGDSKDSWQLAFWFASVNSFLGGERPQDLLAEQPERVIAAALDEYNSVKHG